MLYTIHTEISLTTNCQYNNNNNHLHSLSWPDFMLYFVIIYIGKGGKFQLNFNICMQLWKLANVGGKFNRIDGGGYFVKKTFLNENAIILGIFENISKQENAVIFNIIQRIFSITSLIFKGNQNTQCHMHNSWETNKAILSIIRPGGKYGNT